MSSTGAAPPGLRVAIAYDCLFPLTVGGAERWYRALAEGLAKAGHSVTYLTRQQWDGEPPVIPGVDVVGVSGRTELYDAQGVRRLVPTLRYGAGLARFLAQHRHDFDIVHTANFPFWSVLGARAALWGTATQLVVDWHEVWSRRFWVEYAGRLQGIVGWAVQRACIAASTHPVVTSPANESRYRAAGGRPPLVLPGFLPDKPMESPHAEPEAATSDPYVLFAGRHIRDKGVDLIPPIAAELARRHSELCFVVAGDGPMRPEVQREAERVAPGVTSFVGFVDHDELDALMARAACLVVPSRREGYGIVLVEAARHGTPSVVAGFPENLAAGLIEPGVNGHVAEPDAEAIAARVADVIALGSTMRRTTAGWYKAASRTATIERSVVRVRDMYATLGSVPDR